MRRSRAVVAFAAAAVALAAPADALAAKKFKGKTEQGRTIALTIGDDGRLETANINWLTRDCKQANSRFQNFTRYRRPFDSSTKNAFSDVGSYTVTEGQIKATVKLTFKGRRTASPERWDGTLSGKVLVRRNGKQIDSCNLKSLTWRAELVR